MSATFRYIQRSTLAALAAAAVIACGSDKPKASTTTSAGADATVQPVAAATVESSGAAAAVPAVSASYEDGDYAFRRGRYEEASTIFTAYTERRPDNAWGHYMLGLSSWKAGNLARAVQAFDRALSLDSNHVKSLVNSSRVYLELNQPAEALGRIEQALAIDSTSSETLRLLGRALHSGGNVDGAIDAYRRALVVDERDVWAMNNLGLIYLELGRADEALAPLARAVELRGNAPVFRNNLGIALERTGHYAAARDAFEATLDADSTYGKAAVSLARVTPLVAQGVLDSLDLGEIAGQFEIQVRMWRQESGEPGTADSTIVPMVIPDGE